MRTSDRQGGPGEPPSQARRRWKPVRSRRRPCPWLRHAFRPAHRRRPCPAHGRPPPGRRASRGSRRRSRRHPTESGGRLQGRKERGSPLARSPHPWHGEALRAFHQRGRTVFEETRRQPDCGYLPPIRPPTLTRVSHGSMERARRENGKDPKMQTWRAHRQGLDGALAGKSPAEVLEKTGWARSVGGVGPYLTLFARAGTSRAAADAAVAKLAIHELPSARGCAYVVPASDFALALAAG